MSDMKTLKKSVETVNVDDKFAQPDGGREEKDEKQEAVPVAGTEDTPQGSSPEKTSEQVDEKKDELAEIKKALDSAKGESEHTKNAMQKRIDQLTSELKSIKEQSESKKEKTWDDLNSKEIEDYIAHYSDEGNGKMVAFLTDKLTDKKINERFSKNNQETQSHTVRRQTWDATVNEFPDLKNPESEHYKRTLEMVNSDPRYNDIQKFPEGHAVAARMVAVDILREQLKNQGVKSKEADAIAKKQVAKNSLDVSSGRNTGASDKDDLSKAMDRAMDSKNPYGSEWKEVLRKINSAK